MIIANFEHEKKLFASGFDFVFGIDEAGRGPLAGPVVASACALKPKIIQVLKNCPEELIESEFKLIRDSKTLSDKQREAIFDFIHNYFYVGVGICDHETIDRLNILEASFLAMKKAIFELKSHNKNQKFYETRNIILVDGNKIIPSLSMEQRAIVSGDALVKSIAAASIIAKVTRDRLICEADKLYPQYGFSKHKGYGTKKHLESLKKYGPCEIHRKTFAPIKNLFC